MQHDQTIDYVEFPAADIESVQRFYEGAFGWSFTSYGPEYTSFSGGTIQGGLRRADVRSTWEQGAPLVVIYARDLEATRDTIVRVGGTVVKDIFPFPGGRRFHFTDPNGNELAVWSDQKME